MWAASADCVEVVMSLLVRVVLDMYAYESVLALVSLNVCLSVRAIVCTRMNTFFYVL